MEVLEAEEIIEVSSWTFASLNHAKRLLTRGFTPAQVGSRLKLSQMQIEELAGDYVSEVPEPVNETHEQWRARAAKRIEKKVVGLAEKHLSGLELSESDDGILVLDKDTMSTVVDASAIVHKWLRSGEEGKATNNVQINFSTLAQADPDANARGSGQAFEVIQVESEPVESDDWLD